MDKLSSIETNPQSSDQWFVLPEQTVDQWIVLPKKTDKTDNVWVLLPKQRASGFRPDIVPLGVITQFLNLHEMNTLGQVNKTWSHKVNVEPNKRSYIDRACSFLVAFHVQQLLFSNSEACPMSISKLFLLDEIGQLFNFKILPFPHIYYFSVNDIDLVFERLDSGVTRPRSYDEIILILNEALSQLKQCTELRSLSLIGLTSDINSVIFSYMKYFVRLQNLSLSDCSIGSSSLNQLRGLTALRALNLKNIQYWDDSRNRFAGESLPEFWVKAPNVMIESKPSIYERKSSLMQRRSESDKKEGYYSKMWHQHLGKKSKPSPSLLSLETLAGIANKADRFAGQVLDFGQPSGYTIYTFIINPIERATDNQGEFSFRRLFWPER